MIGQEALDYFKAEVLSSLGLEMRLGRYYAGVRLVATANVASLSGAQTLDGVATNTGDTVFLPLQTDPTQIGLWTTAAGAWTRAAVQHFNGLHVIATAGNTQAAIIWILSGPKKIADIVFGTSLFGAALAASTVTTTLSGQRNKARAIYADTTGGILALSMPSDVLYEGLEFRFIDSAPATSWGSNTLTVNGNGLRINNAATLPLNNGSRTDVSLRHNGTSYTVRGL